MRTNPVQAAALEAIAAGLAPIPIVAGERKPLGEWRADQFRPMEAARVPVRFRNGCNIGIACGIGSGGLECIDFDKADLWQPFLDTLEGVNPDLRTRLRVWQETPSGGYHLLYRVHGQVAGNQKLASSKPHRGADGILKQDTWIETRGAGGQFVIAPMGSCIRIVSMGSWRACRPSPRSSVLCFLASLALSMRVAIVTVGSNPCVTSTKVQPATDQATGSTGKPIGPPC
jgi:hypothetical protein